MVKNLLKSLKTFKIDAECLVYIVFHIKMMLNQRKVLFLHAKKCQLTTLAIILQ